jgi:VanZ family protein
MIEAIYHDVWSKNKHRSFCNLETLEKLHKLALILTLEPNTIWKEGLSSKHKQYLKRWDLIKHFTQYFLLAFIFNK